MEEKPEDVFHTSQEKNHREYRVNPICLYKSIRGFIVNVHDAINYDIDFDLPSEEHRNFSSIISNTYIYRTEYIIPDLTTEEDHPQEESTGIVYRCRLRGVGMSSLDSPSNYRKGIVAFIEINRLIYRTNGWIYCNIYKGDIHHRLLVDIIVPYGGEPKEWINIANFLLHEPPQSRPIEERTLLYRKIFFPYYGNSLL